MRIKILLLIVGLVIGGKVSDASAKPRPPKLGETCKSGKQCPAKTECRPHSTIGPLLWVCQWKPKTRKLGQSCMSQRACISGLCFDRKCRQSHTKKFGEECVMHLQCKKGLSCYEKKCTWSLYSRSKGQKCFFHSQCKKGPGEGSYYSCVKGLCIRGSKVCGPKARKAKRCRNAQCRWHYRYHVALRNIVYSKKGHAHQMAFHPDTRFIYKCKKYFR